MQDQGTDSPCHVFDRHAAADGMRSNGFHHPPRMNTKHVIRIDCPESSMWRIYGSESMNGKIHGPKSLKSPVNHTIVCRPDGFHNHRLLENGPLTISVHVWRHPFIGYSLTQRKRSGKNSMHRPEFGFRVNMRVELGFVDQVQIRSESQS